MYRIQTPMPDSTPPALVVRDHLPAGRESLAAAIADPFFAEILFDTLPDVVFFIKDMQGRYLVVNRTLAERCGVRDKAGLIGRTAAQVFPGLGESYSEQD